MCFSLQLEVVVDQYKQDLQLAKDRQISHDKAAKKAISQLQQEMILRVDQVFSKYTLNCLRSVKGSQLDAFSPWAIV